MATVSWLNGVSGNWNNTPADWSTDAPPQASDDAVISVAGSYTVSITSQIAAINSLTIGDASATLAIADPGVTQTVAGNVTNDGIMDVDLSDTGGSNVSIGGTLTNNGTINIGNSTLTTVTTVSVAGLVNNGTIDLTGDAGSKFVITDTDAALVFGKFFLSDAEFDLPTGVTLASIDSGWDLNLAGASAQIQAAGNSGTNSGLASLNDIQSGATLALQNGPTVTIGNSLSVAGDFLVDTESGAGGSSVTVNGIMSLDGFLEISNFGLTTASPTKVTVGGLAIGSGGGIAIDSGNSGGSTLTVTESVPTTLPGALQLSAIGSGSVSCTWGGGFIQTIASTGIVTLSGANAQMNTTGASGLNSTLNQLTENDGIFQLWNGATVNTGGGIDFSNNGSVNLDNVTSGGSSLGIGGNFLNNFDVTVGNQFSAITSPVTLTVTGSFTNDDSLQMFGGSTGAIATLTVGAWTDADLASFGAFSVLNASSASVQNGGLLTLAGGTINVTSGLSIASGGSVSGFGTITGAISGTGIVEASGGTLELFSPISAFDGMINGDSFDIANLVMDSLLLDSAPGTGNTFSFLGNMGDLALANDTGFNSTVSGLNVGTSGAKTNFVDIEGHTVTISSVTGQGFTSGTITLSDGAVLNLTNLSSTAWFANAVGDGSSGTDIYVSDTACYCRGTRILTDRGEVAVEELAIGDKVVTVSGEARPIRWIGHRAYAGNFIAGNTAILPIRIAEGAFANNVPTRDLFISPEHALYMDGALVPARLLTNGATIRQVESVERLEYFHIELGAHNIIFADGMPAESYVDCDNRGMFHNAGEFARLYPGDERPAWQFCAPRLAETSVELSPIRAALLEHAEALGYYLTDDPDLHLVVDGKIVRPDTVAGCVYRFAIPAGGAEVWLASRSAVPAEVEAASRDIRRLGAAVECIALNDGDLSIEAGHGHTTLCDGFHADEGSHRWTDGLARLPESWLRSFPRGATLDVHLIPTALTYRLPPSARIAATAA